MTVDTRKSGEEFHPDYVNDFHKKVSGCMVWGEISGQKGKGQLVCYVFQVFL
jgi:hypothetical protein